MVAILVTCMYIFVFRSVKCKPKYFTKLFFLFDYTVKILG